MSGRLNVIVLPLFLLLLFIVFISTSCRFMNYQYNTFILKEREQRGRMEKKSGEIRETKE